MFQNRRFGVQIYLVLELQIAAICVAIVRNSLAFCNSVSADGSGMAASRFQAAAAVSVILKPRAVNRKTRHARWHRASNIFTGLARTTQWHATFSFGLPFLCKGLQLGGGKNQLNLAALWTCALMAQLICNLF